MDGCSVASIACTASGDSCRISASICSSLATGVPFDAGGGAMGVVDELVRARAEFERGDWMAAFERWSALDPGGLTADDLAAAGAAAQLLGRIEDAVDRYRRSFDARLAADDVAGAARCAFNLSMLLRGQGDHSAASAWLARGDRLAADLPEDGLERGYLTFSRMFTHLEQGDFVDALACAVVATEAGRRHGDHGLLAVGLCAQGRMAIYIGRVPEGIALLDESMLEATSRSIEPVLLGNVYCTAIEGCQEVSDFRRVAEWTQLLHRWCAEQPGLVTFTGQCSLHRGQLMRASGAWDEAIGELRAAIERYRLAGATPAIGQAACEIGDLLRLRGDFAAAEAAYQLSAEHGHDPPLRDAQSEALGIHPRDRAADAVAQHRKPVGQDVLEVERGGVAVRAHAASRLASSFI